MLYYGNEKLLEEVVRDVRALPESEQDRVAEVIFSLLRGWEEMASMG